MYRESASSFQVARELGLASSIGVALAAAHAPAAPRHFLFVSAPFGPFCRDLAKVLRDAGAQCTRVILNAGDTVDWGLKGTAPYFGGLPGWRIWLHEQILARGVTDVVTYGDSSPYAAEALILGRELGLRRHVLEQGYFRPEWLTLERDGVNGNSPLPRDPEWYLNHPACDRHTSERRVGRTMRSAVLLITRYHAAMYAGALAFSGYRASYQHSAVRQAWGHIWRFVGGQFGAGTQRRAHERVMSLATPTYLALLQRPGDSQLWRHSDFETTGAFVDKVVPSFAANAPAGAQLIVRPHPLDPGIEDHGKLVARVARREGVADRVHYLEHGKLHEILPKMCGAVCVNSTAGLAAIEFGRPTLTLGKAVYDIPGLTHQGGLDGFWSAPQAPNAALYAAFRRVLMATSQVNGAYATAFGRRLAAPEVARRLLNQAV